MTAIVLPDIDRSTLAELRERMPSLKLSEIDLPSLEHAGRDADLAIDRLLGRSRPSIWPWLTAAIGFAVISAAAVALISWFRRPAWPEPTPSQARTETSGGASSAPDLAEIEALAFMAEEDASATEGGRR